MEYILGRGMVSRRDGGSGRTFLLSQEGTVGSAAIERGHVLALAKP